METSEVIALIAAIVTVLAIAYFATVTALDSILKSESSQDDLKPKPEPEPEPQPQPEPKPEPASESPSKKEKSQKAELFTPLIIGTVVAAVFCGILKGIGYPMEGLGTLLMNVACVLAAFSIMIGYKRKSPFHKFVFKLTICLTVLGVTILLLGACGIFLTGMTTFLLCLITVTAMYLISLKS
jgi:amino acid transporter